LVIIAIHILPLNKFHIKDIKKHLIKHIKEADSVFGCVAWLTDFEILDALAKKEVQIVVQKEDFLRPEEKITNEFSRSKFKQLLHKKYSCLNDPGLCFGTLYEDHNFSGISYKSFCDGAIRCVGNHNSDKNPSHPRMHNKFIVLCRKRAMIKEECGYEHQPRPIPYAVWTGSFNFSKNAGYSFENALLITDQKIVDAYFNEYLQIHAFSETLNWESDWVEPEYRIGS
jgi:hypothetical protein